MFTYVVFIDMSIALVIFYLYLLRLLESLGFLMPSCISVSVCFAFPRFPSPLTHSF